VTTAEQARRIVGHFDALQGLRLVPLGIALLCMGAAEAAFPLNRDGVRAHLSILLWLLAGVVVAFALAILICTRISAWYRRQYGSVEPTAHQRRMAGLIGGFATLLIALPLNVEGALRGYFDEGWPVNISLLALSLGIVAYWWYLGRYARHYLVLAGVGLALGLASIAGLPPPTWAWHLRETTIYFALASIIAGLLDHRMLSRNLSEPRNEIAVNL
jgi:hypothetical protein